MPKYYFNLAGQNSAQDVIGQDWGDDEAAKQHRTSLANKFGLERPEMVEEGYYISIVRENNEIARISLAPE